MIFHYFFQFILIFPNIFISNRKINSTVKNRIKYSTAFDNYTLPVFMLKKTSKHVFLPHNVSFSRIILQEEICAIISYCPITYLFPIVLARHRSSNMQIIITFSRMQHQQFRKAFKVFSYPHSSVKYCLAVWERQAKFF